MINFDGKEMQEEFNKVFRNISETGKIIAPQINNLTVEQLWWLTKFAKHVRGRCRSNSAFNNYMNRNFSPAQFKEIPKEHDGNHYKGLQIKVGENVLEDKE